MHFLLTRTQANKRTTLFYIAGEFEKQFSVKALQEPQYKVYYAFKYSFKEPVSIILLYQTNPLSGFIFFPEK